MSTGYSTSMVARIKKADKRLVGVQLGLACIRKNVPVSEVAAAVGVSRQTVYHWFCGEHSPQGALKDTLQAFLKTLD